MPGLRNYWSACAVLAGFSQAGGVGLALAEWMVDGEPSRDVFAMDFARFGDYCTPADFIGKAAALAEREAGVARKLCTFDVDASDADPVAWEPIWHAGEVVGFVTSGGYSHWAQKSIAYGFLPVELIEEWREVEIEILGEMVPARLYSEPLFDPNNEYLRG